MANNFAEKNRERVERLLDRDPAAVRAVVVNTVETQRLTFKLRVLDMIASKTRREMGFAIDFDQAKKILSQFSKIEESIDKLIADAIEFDIYKPQKTKRKLKEVRAELEECIDKGLTPKEICKKTLIDIPTIEKWIEHIKIEREKEAAAANKEEKKEATEAKKEGK